MFGSLPQFHLIDPLGESKGAQTLVTALERRTEVDEHQRLAVPAQAILQEVRQLRVAEGHVLGPIGEAREDVAQAAQALVDGLRLLEALRVGRGATPVETLRPREVAEVERPLHGRTALLVAPAQLQHEDGVAARALRVHLGIRHGPK